MPRTRKASESLCLTGPAIELVLDWSDLPENERDEFADRRSSLCSIGPISLKMSATNSPARSPPEPPGGVSRLPSEPHTNGRAIFDSSAR
jgi:hypothetical protein